MSDQNASPDSAEVAGPSLESLLAQGFREEIDSTRSSAETPDAALPAPPTVDVEDALFGPEDMDAEAAAEAPPEASPPPAAEAPPEEAEADAQRAEEERRTLADSWGKALAENPKRISEVPRPLMARALEAALTRAAEYGAGRIATEAEALMQQRERAAYSSGFEAAQQAAQLEAETMALDSMAQSEPEEFAKLARSGDPRVARYLNRKAAESSPRPDPGLMGAAREWMQVAQQTGLTETLQSYERQQPGRYAPTPQGLANLRGDIARLQSQRAAPPAGQSQAPAPSSAQDAASDRSAARRQAAAAARRNLPKPDVGPSASGGEVLPNDPAELLRMGFRREILSNR